MLKKPTIYPKINLQESNTHASRVTNHAPSESQQCQPTPHTMEGGLGTELGGTGLAQD